MSLHLNRIDRPPKPFLLTTIDGKNVSTEEYRGRWLYLVFHRHLA